MVHLATCDAPFSLDDLAARIRKSSNFRVSWQFYQCSGIDPQSPANIRQALEAIIATPELHKFLQESFEPMYAKAFEIEPLHKHCSVDAATGEFENTLARAASDHLGAYSRSLRRQTQPKLKKLRIYSDLLVNTAHTSYCHGVAGIPTTTYSAVGSSA